MTQWNTDFIISYTWKQSMGKRGGSKTTSLIDPPTRLLGKEENRFSYAVFFLYYRGKKR